MMLFQLQFGVARPLANCLTRLKLTILSQFRESSDPLLAKCTWRCTQTLQEKNVMCYNIGSSIAIISSNIDFSRYHRLDNNNFIAKSTHLLVVRMHRGATLSPMMDNQSNFPPVTLSSMYILNASKLWLARQLLCEFHLT